MLIGVDSVPFEESVSPKIKMCSVKGCALQNSLRCNYQLEQRKYPTLERSVHKS